MCRVICHVVCHVMSHVVCFRYSARNPWFWIGYDYLNSKVYLRGTSDIQSWAIWEPGQRDNMGGNEFCISVSGPQAKWYDVPCTWYTTNMAICSKVIGN